jgi:hypothetical protein
MSTPASIIANALRKPGPLAVRTHRKKYESYDQEPLHGHFNVCMAQARSTGPVDGFLPRNRMLLHMIPP